MLKFFKFLLISSIFMGCTDKYVVVAPTLPQYIRKIAIQPFEDIENRSKFSDFAEKLTLTTKDKFISDRRINVVSIEESDAILKGKVSRYLLSPLEYSSAKVPTKYLLWIWIDITLYDSSTKNVLWTEERLESKIQYITQNAPAFDPTTEVEAQNIAIDELSTNIVKRTIDGWFEASGVSERK